MKNNVVPQRHCARRCSIANTSGGGNAEEGQDTRMRGFGLCLRSLLSPEQLDLPPCRTLPSGVYAGSGGGLYPPLPSAGVPPPPPLPLRNNQRIS